MRGGLIDQEADFTRFARNSHRHRIGADDRPIAANRGNSRYRIGVTNGKQPFARQIAGVKAERRGIVRMGNTKRRNAVFLGGRNELAKAFFDGGVGKSATGVHHNGGWRQGAQFRLGPAVDFAAFEVQAIKLQPVEAVTLKSR